MTRKLGVTIRVEGYDRSVKNLRRVPWVAYQCASDRSDRARCATESRPIEDKSLDFEKEIFGREVNESLTASHGPSCRSAVNIPYRVINIRGSDHPPDTFPAHSRIKVIGKQWRNKQH
jgi:hypothetical protein